MGKSRCCKAVFWRFGARRRRCSACKRTWSVWPKKRGRPVLRIDDRLVHRVLIGRRTLTELARLAGVSRQAFSYRFLRALELYLRRSSSCEPEDAQHFALLIDGLRFRFKRRPWVLYLMAFKPAQTNRATFIDPVLQEGSESKEAWKRALNTIPPKDRARIRVLVCDNFAGSNTLADENRWILQLCHFHLKASMRTRLGRFHRFTVAARETREQAYRLAERALTTDSEERLAAAKIGLTDIVERRCLPWKLTNIIREFLRRLPSYRAYHRKAELRLPRTTSSIESKGRTIRDLMRHARSVRTPRALRLWATSYLRLRPTVTCRPAVLYTD